MRHRVGQMLSTRCVRLQHVSPQACAYFRVLTFSFPVCRNEFVGGFVMLPEFGSNGVAVVLELSDVVGKGRPVSSLVINMYSPVAGASHWCAINLGAVGTEVYAILVVD
jgi:hypothetical protein